jgi:hypothetical protein
MINEQTQSTVEELSIVFAKNQMRNMREIREQINEGKNPANGYLQFQIDQTNNAIEALLNMCAPTLQDQGGVQ